jgi:hypothetical protein
MSKPEKPEAETEDGSFLSRWSRRKTEARQAPVEPPLPAAPPAEEEIFDPATLPSIDDLTAESDFSLFLKQGVPPALRTAALRKLWLVEPSVVNYQPLVEYNWDFTAPGYGELLPTDDVAKFVKTVFEGTRPATPDATPEIAETEPAQSQALPMPEEQPVAQADDMPSAAEAEPVPERQSEPLPPRRRHGGALPG